MSKNVAGLTLCALLFALCSSAEAQQQLGKIPRIGFVGNAPVHRMDAFRQALRELGWMQGQNIAFDYKYHEPGRDDLLLVRAAELVRLDVDIIVAIATRSALAAQKATKTVPIVFASVSDPVDAGLVESIARPGGNITGIRNLSAELGGKRLELLKEMFPKISRVAVLGTMGAGNQPQMREIEDAADVLRIQLQPVRAEQPHDFEKAFTTIKIEGCEALITLSTPWFDTYKARIVELAASHRLPAIYPRSEFVEDGGLMAYGVSGNEQYRRAAWYVDKVLKGTKPANLPVEQPTKFELVINLKAAKQIGLTIPPQMLMDADRVIKY